MVRVKVKKPKREGLKQTGDAGKRKNDLTQIHRTTAEDETISPPQLLHVFYLTTYIQCAQQQIILSAGPLICFVAHMLRMLI